MAAGIIGASASVDLANAKKQIKFSGSPMVSGPAKSQIGE